MESGLVRVENMSGNLLFYRVHENLWMHGSSDMLEQRHRIADTYAVGIAAALRHWAQEEQEPTDSGDEQTPGILAALKFVAQQFQGTEQVVVVPDMTTLLDETEHFYGGNCMNDLYIPQRIAEPVYHRSPKGTTAGY